MEKLRQLGFFLRDYLIPPSCPACGAILSLEESCAPFCGACRAKWETEKLEICPDCGLPMIDCGCLPPLLAENEITENGISDGIFLTAYHAGGQTVAGKTVLFLKSNRDERVFRFLARELFHQMYRIIRRDEISELQILITALPRRKKGVRENGFDQAAVLARALSAETGFPYCECLSRVRDGREQKQLSSGERFENLRGAFGFIEKNDVVGKTVFLVDDVMTTGSGLSASADVLYQHGAARVIPTVIARTTL